MSWQAEEAHERWFAQHMIECARDLVVGAKVYRANWDRIEEGVVRRVSRTDGKGTIYSERQDGEYPYFVAQFGSDWVGQIQQCRWFFSITDARKDLIREVRARVLDLQHQIERWKTLEAQQAAAIETGGGGR